MEAKKVIFLVFCYSFILTLMAVSSAAVGVPIVYGERTEIFERNSCFEYSVFIKDNTGICGFDISLSFDTAAFQLVPSPEGATCRRGGFTNSGNIVCSQTDTGCRVVWSNTNNADGEGTLFTVFLLPRIGAGNGEFDISISYSGKNTIDENNNQVSLTCQNGKIVLRERIPKLTGSVVQGYPGENVIFQVSIHENPGIAGYRIYLKYNRDVVEVLKENGVICANSSEPFSHGLINCAETPTGCQVIWMSSSNIMEDGILFEIPIKVANGAPPGEYEISVEYSEEDTLDERGKNVSFVTENGALECLPGATVSGTLVTWDNKDNSRFMLYPVTMSDSEIRTDIIRTTPEQTSFAAVKGIIVANKDNKRYDQVFTFTCVNNGDYKLAIYKPDRYVPKIIEIKVNGEDVSLGEVKLWLYGDVTYDGKINGTDAQQIQRYYGGLTSRFGTGSVEDEADRLLAANVTFVRNRDEVINGTDAQQIQRFYAGMTSVFDLMN